jgi:GT2 family glycosyltransferase
MGSGEQRRMIIVVTATRLSKAEFTVGPLGVSLQRMCMDPTLQLGLVEGNCEGLPKVYNRFLIEPLRENILLFLHDDVWLDDMFLSDRIRDSLTVYDVVGVAGSRILRPDAPAWFVKDESMELDIENLSGVVSHGPTPCGAPSVYGTTPAAVQVLDGVLLAVRCSTLLDAGLRFDERFNFHFYDMDLARQANAMGLKVGTWPIAVTHVSGGGYKSQEWKQELEVYREKWK